MALTQGLYLLLSEPERLRFLQLILRGTAKVPEALRKHAVTDEEEFQRALEEGRMVTYLNTKGHPPSYSRNLDSDLGDLLRQFLAALQLENSYFEERLVFLESLVHRKAAFALFVQEWKKVQRRCQALPFRSQQRLEIELALARLLYEAQSIVQNRGKRQSKQQGLPDNALQHCLDALNRYFLIYRESWSQEWHSRGKIARQSDRGTGLWWLEIEKLEEELVRADPVLGKLLQLSRRLFVDGMGYKEMKTLLQEAPLGQAERLNFAIVLQNHCAGQINAGKDPDFLSEYLLWVDYRAQHKLLLHHGQMACPDFKNYITICLKQTPPDPARAEAFYQRFEGSLEPEFAVETRAFNLANIRFHQARFHEALRLLRQQRFADPYNNADGRTLELKIHFETHARDLFDSELNNVKKFLYRTERLPERKRLALLNKVKFMDKLHRTPDKQADWEQLQEKIEQEERVSDRRWLLEKVAERLREF